MKTTINIIHLGNHSNEENPADIVKLQQIAKQVDSNQSLWIAIICRLIDKIEISDPLGPSIIAIFLGKSQLIAFELYLLITQTLYSPLRGDTFTFKSKLSNLSNLNPQASSHD